jgi:actin-like ATPase involved in cell morphogenesis
MGGCGCDIGTCFLVSAKQDANNQIQLKTIRDAFLDMDNDPSVKTMLSMSKINFIESEDKIYLVGDPAVTMANIFKREARRPLSKGVIAPGELEAEKILLILLDNILGKAKAQDEVCYYSVPGNPADRSLDVVYHQAMFSKLIGSLGYKPIAMNEAAAIVYSNCAAEQFSGLAISCLTPGQKIITRRGFKDINLIVPGDEILTKEGLWAKCFPTSRDYTGKVYNLISYGNGDLEVTEDHQIWINRENRWQWVMAKDVQVGDIVLQPWPNFKFDKEDRYICFEETITSSKNSTKRYIGLSSDLYELIGYFLGDGCLEYGNSDTSEACGVGFTFDSDDISNIERVKGLVKDIFNKDAAEYPHGENAIRIKFYSKGFSKWVKDNCYGEDKEKIVPFEISLLNDSNLRSILKGLIETDGYYSENHVGFTHTSANLSQFVYLALHRLGLTPSYCCRDPREGGLVEDGRQIMGKKQVFEINSQGLESQNLISWFKNPVKTAKKQAINGSTIAYIRDIKCRDYSGPVYDVSVEGEDHSFCAPGFAVHNCGAGMINVALLFQTIVGMSFSLVNSGDWLDESAARATGTTASRIQAIKERGLNLMDPNDGDPKTFREREALIVYYKSLILRVLETIKVEFEKRRGSIDLPNAIPLILSGGTSLPKGFKETFEAGFSTVKDKFPIPISEIRMAKDPLNAVAQGLLVAALNYNEGSRT